MKNSKATVKKQFKQPQNIISCTQKGKNKMAKIKQIIEKIKSEEKLTTSEVLTKYPDLAILLEQEEQREKLDESKDERVLLKG